MRSRTPIGGLFYISSLIPLLSIFHSRIANTSLKTPTETKRALASPKVGLFHHHQPKFQPPGGDQQSSTANAFRSSSSCQGSFAGPYKVL